MLGISIILGTVILGIGGFIAWTLFNDDYFICGTTTVVVTIVLLVIVVVGTIWYYNGTESGKRAMKDWQSNISGGITRVVTVYDINGKVISKYEGKFDVEYDSDRIKFDDEEGKRHIIYYSTGTVIIDEK